MLDDKDIEKLKEVFATKEYLKENFAKIDTRFDRLAENFATKTEIEHLIDIVATKDEMREFKNEMNKGFDSLDKKLSDVVGSLGEVRKVLTEAHVL